MKRRASIILCVLLVLTAGLVPVVTPGALAADAGDPEIRLGVSGISGYSKTNGYNHIYYGIWGNILNSQATKGPIKWRVLDTKTNEGGEGLFLLSEEVLGVNARLLFQADCHAHIVDGSWYKGTWTEVSDHSTCSPANEWLNSDAYQWCEEFYEKCLAPQEQKAALKTESDVLAGCDVNQVFFLSDGEINNTAYGLSGIKDRIATYGGDASAWWLRTPDDVPSVGTPYKWGKYIGVGGHVATVQVNDTTYDARARPAVNLDSSMVLFHSAAEGGKATGKVGSIESVSKYEGKAWKLTLKDENRKFKVTDKSPVSGFPGTELTFTYTNATLKTDAAPNEYISVIITDKDEKNVLYYGRLKQPVAGDGNTVTMAIPTDIEDGKYKIKLFSEQYNGGDSDNTKRTDYASAFSDIDLTVDTTAPTLTQGTASRTSNTTATVTFVSNEAGTYYYAVVKSGDNAPTIGTSGMGTACVAGSNTISLTGLEDIDGRDIYIVVKDAYDNVCKPLKIAVPPATYEISVDKTDITFDDETWGYGTVSPKTVNVTNKGNQPVTINYVGLSYFEVSEWPTTPIQPSEPSNTASFTVRPKTGLDARAEPYEATIIVAGTGNVAATVQLSFKVNKAQSSVTQEPAANALTYNGSAQALVTTGSASGGTMQYKLSAEGDDAWRTRVPEATDAGKYTVQYKVVGDSNHDDTEVESVEVTIAPLDVVVNITGNNETVTYDGKEHIVRGFTMEPSNTLYNKEEYFTYSGTTEVAKTDVGTSYMGLDKNLFVNQNDNFNVTFTVVDDGFVMIEKAHVTVSITGNSKTVSYDGKEHSVSGYTVKPDNELYNKEEYFTFSGTAEVKRANIGTSYMELDASLFENTNDNFDVRFTVAKDGYVTIGGYRLNASAGRFMTISPPGIISVPEDGSYTFRFLPYDGWTVGEVIVDGESVSLSPGATSYTFTNVTEDHSIRVTAIKIPKERAPISQESVAKLIDHLVNDTPLDDTYDFDRNGVIDGRDLIVLQRELAS